MSECDDRELIEQTLGGDTRSFERLVDRYHRVVFNVALRITNDVEDACDITQNVFIKARERLESYDPRFKFFSWLYRIAINEALNSIERRRPALPLDQELPAEAKAPDEELDEKELCREVQAAVMELPLHYRQVIVLRHFAGLSYEDLGATLSLPVKTVKSRLFTARRMLRDLLLEHAVRKP